MRAPVLHGTRSISYDELPDPEAGPGEVVLRIDLCGICGSDLHQYASPQAPDGIVMGHEFTGSIAQLGQGVTEWNHGDRVIEGMVEACGSCAFCARGESHFCYQHFLVAAARGEETHGRGRVVAGGFAPYVVIEADRLVRVPDSLDAQQAASVEVAAVALHAVRRSGLRAGDVVIVFGAGPIGLATIQCLRLAGAQRILVVEPNAARAAAALDFGGDETIDPRETEDVVEALQRRTGGGADAVFDTAGVPVTVQQALETARPGGAVTLVGIATGSVPVRPAAWLGRNLTVRGSLAFIRDDVERSLAMVESGALDLGGMVTEIVPSAETGAAFERLLAPTSEIKILVDPQR
jgi:(R,R)-butanediol dehydrogenase/meso-butanediol dehydrogenase/diacetyl reductase